MCREIKLECDTMVYEVGRNITNNLPVIAEMANAIKKAYPRKKIVLWCRGSSGTIIASVIAAKLGKKVTAIAYVRKENEDRHGVGVLYSSNDGKAINVIVDDFIETGKTINAIIDRINSFSEYTDTEFKLDCLCVTGRIPSTYRTQFSTIISTDI